jgi:hypothetical protein
MYETPCLPKRDNRNG